MKLLCVDVESNGLMGKAFCVGAVLLGDDDVEATWLARTSLVGYPSRWVHENVMPAIADVPITHTNLLGMSRDFVTWTNEQVHQHHPVVACYDWGVPVDAGFVVDAYRDVFTAMSRRGDRIDTPVWHEVATLLVAAGLDVNADRWELTGEAKPPLAKHHPLYDAEGSARAARWLLRRTGAWR